MVIPVLLFFWFNNYMPNFQSGFLTYVIQGVNIILHIGLMIVNIIATITTWCLLPLPTIVWSLMHSCGYLSAYNKKSQFQLNTITNVVCWHIHVGYICIIFMSLANTTYSLAYITCIYHRMRVFCSWTTFLGETASQFFKVGYYSMATHNFHEKSAIWVFFRALNMVALYKCLTEASVSHKKHTRSASTNKTMMAVEA